MNEHTKEEVEFRRGFAVTHIERIRDSIINGNIKKLKNYEISIEYYHPIQHMDGYVFNSLKQRCLRYIKDDYSFCSTGFVEAFNLAIEDSNDQKCIDELMRKKAPQELMYRLYGFHSGDFSYRCKLLKIKHRKGRRKIPNIQSQIEVKNQWKRYSYLPEAQRWLQVSNFIRVKVSY